MGTAFGLCRVDGDGLRVGFGAVKDKAGSGVSAPDIVGSSPEMLESLATCCLTFFAEDSEVDETARGEDEMTGKSEVINMERPMKISGQI